MVFLRQGEFLRRVVGMVKRRILLDGELVQRQMPARQLQRRLQLFFPLIGCLIR